MATDRGDEELRRALTASLEGARDAGRLREFPSLDALAAAVRPFIHEGAWPRILAAEPPGGPSSFYGLALVPSGNQILPRFGRAKVATIRREDIERWQAERLADVAGATANKELMRLKHLLNRAVAWGYLRESPARAIKTAKEAPGRVRYCPQRSSTSSSTVGRRRSWPRTAGRGRFITRLTLP